MSRRTLLRTPGAREGTSPLRPPWALAEASFIELCTRCDACITACPTGVLRRGGGGFPITDFSLGACTFCGACVAACAAPSRPQALRRQEGVPPWARVAAIGDGCLSRRGIECRVCGEACEAAAIRFRPRLGGVALPELDAGRCSACGACQAPCPGSAIEMVALAPPSDAPPDASPLSAPNLEEAA
ncbi:ferredoxin-type protein NapF [Azoarcus sp. TTM-91]|uniref:ferredoxin-type protein NapF n=1 Tax=Azoarcus sp. TTM-91 TaxID=2691581 RepID=UPI00145DF7C5|nr:ferredoxin-type protein NapF [Azoarcus sp. TTM-91]NMG35747.1 ferredoxin-type protein NapF [Azoarcus sp. TTM-91]